MKKIMFNDRFGLTEAVLERRKTQTRRVAYDKPMKYEYHIGVENGHLILLDGWCKVATSKYRVGEELWIAQSYQSLGHEPDEWLENIDGGLQPAYELAGYKNKMFARSIYMEHRIRIKSIKVERLQDISDEDCLKEGIILDDTAPSCYKPFYTFPNSVEGGTPVGYKTPRMAFAKLIDFVSHGSVWDSNPWV